MSLQESNSLTIGILFGVAIAAISVILSFNISNARIIGGDFTCSKYEFIGKAPNRREDCTQYTKERK